jgi:benzoyl-CoA reductase/2-hydroxyglutaryl-CoA dehydratase subunit BcrC/BadD/HgdB
LKYFKLELEEFRKQLEEIKGSKITTDKLKKSIKKYNDFKKSLQKLSNLNIKGSQKLEILQEALLYGPEILPKIEDVIKNKQDTKTLKTGKNVVLTGCSIFLNDYLNDLIEDGGGNIVFFDTWIGSNYYSQILDDSIIESSENPINLLIHRFKNNIFGDHSVPNFLSNKVTQIYAFCEKYKKETGMKIGVINHIIKFCDHMSIMSSRLKEQLQSKGIQVLNLERDYSRANRGQLSTRIEAFLEMM